MKKLFTFSLVILVHLCAFNPAFAASANDPSKPEISVGIIFGLRDSVERAWDGAIVPKPGQTMLVEPDHFRGYQYEKKDWKKGIIDIRLPDPKLPNDYMKDSLSWVVSTRDAPLHGPTTEWHDYGVFNSLYDRRALKPVIVHPSVLVHLKCDSLNEAVRVRTVQGHFSFIPADILHDRVRYFLDNNVRVELVPSSEPVADKRTGQQDCPALLTAQSGEIWIVWQEYDGRTDQLLVRKKNNGYWSPAEVMADSGMIFHTALAEDKLHRVWIVWSMEKGHSWNLYGRFYKGKWSPPGRLTGRTDQSCALGYLGHLLRRRPLDRPFVFAPQYRKK